MRINRRTFLAASSVAGAVTMLRMGSARAYHANETPNVAVVGAGMGEVNAANMAKHGANILAVCDCDRRKLDERWQGFPRAHRYVNYREMLDKEKTLDGVVIASPDHWHAHMSVMAMRRGLHCFTQKPLTHSVHEARVLTEVAKETGVVTQMGTQMSTSASCMRTVEYLQAGAIGAVREVHLAVYLRTPLWPQGIPRPDYTDPVPDHLDWNSWIGPAPMRPYVAAHRDGPHAGKPVYHPAMWRGWWDFGTGHFGDQCGHHCNVVFWALPLQAPLRVQTRASGPVSDSFPSWEVLEFEYPASDAQPPLKLVWYDGVDVPLPPELADKIQEGVPLFIGEKGMLQMGNPPRLFPAEDFADYEPPPTKDWGRTEVEADWLRAIQQGTQPGCHFGHAGPMIEGLLLGNVALRVGQRIEWDPVAFRVTNCEQANEFVKREYRKGWEL